MNEANLDNRLITYWRQAGKIVGTIYDAISLKDACTEIADYHTSRANSFFEIIRRTEEKSKLIDSSGSGKSLIGIEEDGGKKYVFDNDGIVVGIAEDGFYYTLKSNDDVEIARTYRRRERNPFLRLWSYPKIMLYYTFPFQLKKFIDEIGRTIVGGAIYLAENSTREGGKGEQEDSGNGSQLEQRIQGSLGEQKDLNRARKINNN